MLEWLHQQTSTTPHECSGTCVREGGTWLALADCQQTVGGGTKEVKGKNYQAQLCHMTKAGVILICKY